ncbi:MAG: helix-turn-helix transcriptional regulator [Clostridiaceae bacterium]|nr:helix-turn-helix transcriptional regulator [Clostridiaceae bacterium]
MWDTFESDISIFSNEISLLMESKDKVTALALVKEKHIKEKLIALNTIDKRNDLIIWNAIYAKEIIKNGTSKASLHPIYNKFYDILQGSKGLEELQTIEINILSTYFNILINEIEVTGNFVINKILQYLHLKIEDYIILQNLAKDLNISVGYASYCFKKNMGMTIMKYAQKIKIERAKTLLKSADYSILHISAQLGFYDQSHFTKTFKQLVGISPSNFRNTNYC